jgi:hypothetical protein
VSHVPENEQRPEPVDRGRPRDARTGQDGVAARIAQQATWVDLQIRQAMERGEFSDLPGHGKPIQGLGAEHDPDWWIKQLAEREKIAVLPPSLQLRKDDAELDDLLDRLNVEAEVRREVEEFNQRVIAARYRLPEGPPLITMPRDVDEAVAAWGARREARRARQAELLRAQQPPPPRRRRWLRRRSS